MILLVGDVQGCDAALDRLLSLAGFSPSRHRLVLLGDLVNRGPQSLAVLRRIVAMGDAATALLGNHDLHLLAVAHGIRPAHRSDTLGEVLQAPDRDALLHWLARRPLTASAGGWLCVHAGLLPAWTPVQAQALAAEVQAHLAGDGLGAFLRTMYGNEPAAWHDDLAGADRLRVVVNALTRRLSAARQSPLVRRPRPRQRRHAGGLRPLEHAGPGAAAGPAGAGHRLRLGRRADGGARGRRPPRSASGALRGGAAARLRGAGAGPGAAQSRSAHGGNCRRDAKEAWPSG
jgi:bis(5'-nucleosyl)-tetraphosphatase (symmetrical)